MKFLTKILAKFLGVITYKKPDHTEPFLLKELPQEANPLQEKQTENPSKGHEDKQLEAQPEKDKNNFRHEALTKQKRTFITPKRANRRKLVNETNNGSTESIDKDHQDQLRKGKADDKKNWGDVSYDLDFNRAKIEEIYDLPTNKDFILREFYLGLTPPVRAFALFMEGLSDKKLINMTVLQPLMVFSYLQAGHSEGDLVEYVKNKVLPGNQVDAFSEFKDIITAVNMGSTAIFLDGCGQAIVAETKGWEHRTVSKPSTEQVIRGPQEAFTETLRVNTALIRKHLPTSELNTEMFKLGIRGHIDIAVMYLRTVANPLLVKEVKRRIKGIKADYIQDSGVLEQLIEDHPYSVVPQIISTERPDRVCLLLAQGHVAVLMDSSPFVLVMPGTLFTQLHTPEDVYLRPIYGTAVRLIRTFSFYIAFLLPGLYLSIVLFHQEMIPTDLLLAIAGAREKVPFPSIVEVIIMEVSFELIREAGVRIPGILGSTIGIVGALILGQAAVQANIVSPILIIITATTGLAAFAIPNYSLQFALRILRFIYILLGGMLGFFGIAFGVFCQVISMSAMKSFGVPYIAPAAPQTRTGRGALIRAFVWNMERRPDYLQTHNQNAQPKITRQWLKNNDSEQKDSVNSKTEKE